VKIVEQAIELRAAERPLCLAIGMFDGVHLGHQQVLRQAVTNAEQQEGWAVAVTFDRHPASVVAPARAPSLIYPLWQKLHVMSGLGMDAAWLIQFDRAFSQQSGEAFVRRLAADWPSISSVCVGSAFSFGCDRKGNVDLLRRLGEELGFVVHGLAVVALDGHTVSSTRIREAVRAGSLDAAQQMMGREYALCGKVVEGDRLGRQLGFPTANLEADGLILPPMGVYAVHAQVGAARYRAVLNLGRRPTLRNPHPSLRVEAHLLDFSGDLYGQEVELTFTSKLRDERPFPDLAALRQQITADVAEARRRFRS
jgi:riboflavin kinase / FMN adenylyltransferase